MASAPHGGKELGQGQHKPTHGEPAIHAASRWLLAVGVSALFCALATQLNAAEPAAFVYRNPYLLVTQGTATVTDAAGNRKVLEAVDNGNTTTKKPENEETPPCVAILSGGELVETSAGCAASIFDPSVGTLLLCENSSVRFPPVPPDPKAGNGSPQKPDVGSSLELLRGRLSIDIDGEKLRKAQESPEFRLRMPMNILAVKGTEFTAIHEAGLTGVVMSEGAVELRSTEGKPVAVLQPRKRKDTLYRIDGRGMVSATEEYSEADAGISMTGFLAAEPDLHRRKITLTANESGTNGKNRDSVPNRQMDYAALEPADAEGIVRWTYQKPKRAGIGDWAPWAMLLRIEMPERYRTSPKGLLFKIRSNVRLEEASLHGGLTNKTGAGFSGHRFAGIEPREGLDLKLGLTNGWQAVYIPLVELPLNDNTGAGPGESELSIFLKTPHDLKGFEIEISPVLFVGEGGATE